MTKHDPHQPRSNRLIHVASTSLVTLAIGGCASVPDVTVAYQPVTWAVGTSVVQTITCSRDGKQAIIARGATFTPIYQADKVARPLTLKLKDLDRFFADSELTTGFTDDGRLKSINQSATGQGEAITKALVTSVVSVGSAGAVKGIATAPALMSNNLSKQLLLSEKAFSLLEGELYLERNLPISPSSLCKVVMDWTTVDTSKGGLPQISVIQTRTIGPTDLPGGTVAVAKADAQSASLIKALSEAGFDASAQLKFNLPVPPQKSGNQPILEPIVKHGEVPLTIQQTSTLTMEAFRQEGNTTERISSASVNVPLAENLTLPIPRAALFGKQSFQLQLGESGRISALGYARTSGAPGMLNAISSVASEQSAQDSADAAALKAASDLIVQQNRHSNCLLNRDECK